MIFADKLVQLRKKAGWSQEELAEQMEVSRQSVSKWEGAQSIPDLEKIVRLSNLFGVSIDYLLKDEIEESEITPSVSDCPSVRRVSMEEANAFLAAKQEKAKLFPLGIFLYIVSPICLTLLGAISEIPSYHLSENVAGGIGGIVLLVLCAIATCICVASNSKTAPFAYLRKEIFETEYGVSGMVKERRDSYKPTHVQRNMIGICLLILSLVPIFIGAIFSKEEDSLFQSFMMCPYFILVAVGVSVLVSNRVIWSSFKQLLQEGNFSKEEKFNSSYTSSDSLIYWSIFTAIYFGYSFITNDWETSWVIWFIAGILFPAFVRIIKKRR